MPIFRKPFAAALVFVLVLSPLVLAQNQGPSTKSRVYVLPTQAGIETTSVITVDNTGATADDTVPNTSTSTPAYGLGGIPDGEGAFDNLDGTFTLLVNHEIVSGGAVRRHGSSGAYVSKWIINKNTLTVVSGEDLIKEVFAWDATAQKSSTTSATTSFTRFCSADLPEVSAFFNPSSGLGSQQRIFMNGEEAGNGRQIATVVNGTDAGKSYILGKFNLSTNGSGLTGVGSWENSLASPFPQDKTIVMNNSDGGTGIMNNAVAVYVGTKQNFGSEVDKAGLTNGTLKFVSVTGNPLEIVNGTTRATNITNGARFTLSAATSTTFSRPEDGAWNPLNPLQYYFVTTDQLDQVSDGLGGQIGQTRLWRLTFDNITNPDLGGTIDLLISGRTVAGQKVNMFDNIAVHKTSGHILLQEDVGGAAHNGKIWEYDPSTFTGATNSGALTMIAKHDPALFGDAPGAGVTTPATAPYNNDEETSGIIDITAIMAGSVLNKGNPREAWYISSDQAHYTTGITSDQVEGGQIFVVHEIAPDNNVKVTRSGLVRDRRTGTFAQEVTLTNTTAVTLAGPFYLLLDNLNEAVTLSNKGGNAASYVPASPYILVSAGPLAPGATAAVTLQFANPNSSAFSYADRTLNSVPVP